MKARWYLSAKAVREYLKLVGRVDDDGGPEWARAERELAKLCAGAHLLERPSRSGHQQWRTGRPLRLTLIVSTEKREEGPLDQLVGIVGGRTRRTEQRA